MIATDLDTRFLAMIEAPNLEVCRDNIVSDDLPEGEFDLVHCRLLLEHLPEADRALSNMVAALKPGGRLLVEEFDHTTFLPDACADDAAQEAWYDWLAAFTVLAERRGTDLLYGQRLFSLLSQRGLGDVHAEGRTVTERGGSAGRGLLRLSVISLKQQLIDTGEIDAATLDRLVALVEDPSFSWASQLMVSAWGTRAD